MSTAEGGAATDIGGYGGNWVRCLAIAEAIEQRLGPLTPIDPVAG